MIKGSPWEQGEDEQIAYSIDTTPWGITCPLSPSMVVLLNGSDVTASKTTGSAAIGTCATCIVFGRFDNPVPASTYRIQITFKDNLSTPNTYGAYVEITGAS
jgi:hypothetical protein